jgi:hypothetical protein
MAMIMHIVLKLADIEGKHIYIDGCDTFEDPAIQQTQSFVD